jgi:hypothetical protein
MPRKGGATAGSALAAIPIVSRIAPATASVVKNLTNIAVAPYRAGPCNRKILAWLFDTGIGDFWELHDDAVEETRVVAARAPIKLGFAWVFELCQGNLAL